MINKKSLYLLLLLVLFAIACNPSADQTEEIAPPDSIVQPTQSETASDDVHPAETSIPSTKIPKPTQKATLELSKDLVRGCLRGDQTDYQLREGDSAVEFSLMDVDGETYVLSELLQEKPVALIYGSYT